MTKNEVLTLSRNYFKNIGFQTLKKSKFYYDSDDLILRVWIIHSNFGDFYYIDYFIYLKALHKNELFNDLNWDVSGRLNFDHKKCFEVYYASLDKDYFLKCLKELSEKQLLPIMEKGTSYIKTLISNSNSFGSDILFKKDDREKLLSL